MSTRILYLAFFLSGLAGLIYETIWSRYLGLFVGHGAYAQVIVLVIFLGGMAVGALLAGQRSERIASPLRAYSLIELAVGAAGLLFHQAYQAVTDWAYAGLLPGLEAGWTVHAVKWALAAGLILPQSIALGATFPLMTAAFLRRARQRAGGVVAILYFINSLGAAGGALFTGFVLIGWVGLPGSLIFAAMLNLIAAAVALLVAGRSEAVGPVRHGEPLVPGVGGVAVAPVERRSLWRLMLAVSFGTAAASFIYEVSWIRMLSLVLGSATHAFELMLSAFIAGLAFGALWIHRRADRLADPQRTLAIVQWLMGLAALATLPLYIASFGWTGALVRAVEPTHEGYLLFTAARYGIALAVMLPSTFFAGMTLPLITRILMGADSGERAVGWVYGVNTLGSIVGVAVAALLLLPLIGLKPLLIVGALLDMALGVVLLARGAGVSRRRFAPAAAALTVLVVALAVWGTELDRAVLTSGVYRSGRIPQEGQPEPEILYYRDGRTATVAVVDDPGGLRILSTNGKGDASVSRNWLRPDFAERRSLEHDEPTQILLGLISLAHNPAARTAAVIGQGSGVTTHMLLASPSIESVVTMEIEPAIIEGSRAFHPANARTFHDPRSSFILDDARSALSAGRREFDLIVAEPSNPWVSGVDALFTVEFYRRVRQHLSADGVFGQWLHLYEISDPLVLSVLSAIHQVFPSYDIFRVNVADILLVASTRERPATPDWSVFEQPAVRESLRRTHPFTPAYLESTRLIGRDVLAPLLDRGVPANSDFYPILGLGAEEARVRNLRSSLGRLAAGRFDVSTFFLPGRGVPRTPSLPPVPQVPDMAALSLAGRIRAARAGTLPDSLAGSGRLGQVLFGVDRLDRQLGSATPPGDWRAWLADLVRVEALLHGGAIGVADEDFFQRAAAFAGRHDAPESIRSAVAFLHGLAVRDFDGAARALDPLLTEAAAGRLLLPPTLLQDAGVLARLATGDVAGARRAFDVLASHTGDRDDIPYRLVLAHLRAAEGGGSAAP